MAANDSTAGSLALRIDDLISDIRNNGRFAYIRRQPMLRYDLCNIASAIVAAGRERNPRFAIDAQNRDAYEAIIKWVLNDQTMTATDPTTGKKVQGDLTKGLFVAGNTGSGKSWALEMGAYLAKITGRRFKAGNGEYPLAWRNVRAMEIADEWSKSGDLEQWRSAPILGIQDLGSEPAESVYMGNRQDVLRQLLEYRGDCPGKITHITSNLTYADIERRYGDRVLSRLYGMCNFVLIVGKDRRQAL